jgi:hypothetical protein
MSGERQRGYAAFCFLLFAFCFSVGAGLPAMAAYEPAICSAPMMLAGPPPDCFHQ